VYLLRGTDWISKNNSRISQPSQRHKFEPRTSGTRSSAN